MQNAILFKEAYNTVRAVQPFRTQLLKWVGNKQRFANKIISFFPDTFNHYYEPFLGSGAVLGTLSHPNAVASDCFKPLIEIWQTLSSSPETLKLWYKERWKLINGHGKKDAYKKIKVSYNANPNGADLLFLCRACYGGVVRFRKLDGYMSTPCGIHDPISPESFSKRVDLWAERTSGTKFILSDYKNTMEQTQTGDMIYCDPPYSHTQSILYGAQSFSLEELFDIILKCKNRGVFVALSIDGSKKSGRYDCNLPIPDGLFEREVLVNCGRSMLRRFQMNGKTLEKEVVKDRLLLTY